MRCFYLILIFLFTNAALAIAQQDINWAVVRKIDIAKMYLCDKDTLAAITQLSQIEKVYPNDAHIFVTSKVLGDLYLMKGETKKSLHSLYLAFNSVHGPCVYRDSSTCDKLFNRFSLAQSKADICISISKAYLAERNFDSSIHYLNLADGKYLAYQGCGNGMITYKSYLSLFFANHFIAQGDTTQAINRILDFFMLPDGNMKVLTEKIKAILRYTYSQQQINDEVEHGLRNLKIVKGKKGQPKNILEFTLFKHVILSDAHDKTVEEWQYLIAKEESIKQLRN